MKKNLVEDLRKLNVPDKFVNRLIKTDERLEEIDEQLIPHVLPQKQLRKYPGTATIFLRRVTGLKGPLYILVHIASVWVPFTSEGKEAVANYDPIRKEMKLALQEAGRKLGRYIGRKERKAIQEKKKRQLTSYAKEIKAYLIF
ncbi:DNA topoisomerase VI subunit B [Candidatus Haloredivivus sp. G17]|nr:DNA topoisomerase VI subunit B [Candidatus Haloredivivus sp. G17]